MTEPWRRDLGRPSTVRPGLSDYADTRTVPTALPTLTYPSPASRCNTVCVFLFVSAVRRELSRNKRTMWILSSIAVVFALSWLPLTVFTLVVEFQPHLIQSTDTLYKAFAVVHMMAMSTTCTNPLLYGWLNTNFRRDISGICRQMWYCGDQKPPPRRKRHPSVATDYRGPGDRRMPGPGSEALPGGRRHHHDAETTGLSIVVRSDRRFSTSYLTTLTTVTSRSQPGSSTGRVEHV